MFTKIIEATNGVNWGKFMLGRMDQEWERRSSISKLPIPMLQELGWDRDHYLWVFDLQTGEAALFRINRHGLARGDLNKHRIWVCPLYEPFLQWLYQQDLSALTALPDKVDLPGAESALYGYRRPGPK